MKKIQVKEENKQVEVKVFVQPKDYQLVGILEDDIDVIEGFINTDYDGVIGDIISEIAENYTPIYNSDVWLNASSISMYIEEAISSNLVPISSQHVNLIHILQAGYELYYREVLHDNLETMIYNMLANHTNEFLSALPEEVINTMDFNELLDALGIEAEYISSNLDYHLDFIPIRVNELVDELTDGMDE